MTRVFLFLAFCLMSAIGLPGQSSVDFKSDVLAWRAQQHDIFKSEELSPLTAEDREQFERLPYYKPKAKFRITARIKRTLDAKPFEMITTTERRPLYIEYGKAEFELKGNRFSIPIYKNLEYTRNPLYRNRLFFPFTDRSNRGKTYGGGRYIEVIAEEGDMAVIDFNKAYNPYCAYNAKYSCPVVPKSNNLNIKVNAGVKKHKH